MPFDRAEAFRAALLAIAGIIVIVAVMLCLPQARATATWNRDGAEASPETQAWFQAQRNAAGERCCDQADGHPFYGAYKINPDGSVTLQTDKGPYTLPSYMVLKGSNPTGHAVWWFTASRDYCFAPGSQS